MADKGKKRVQELFLAALELSFEARDAWLAEQCGDNQELLAEVRSLLDHDSPDDDVLEKGLGVALGNFRSALDLGGDRVKDAGDAAPAINSESFLSKLSDIGILSSGEDDVLSRAIADAEDSGDPRQLASALIENGTLTEFQASALLQGQPELLIDKYLILDLLGAGGMGTVFKAIHRPMNRMVALKKISEHLLYSPDQIKRFQREVRIAATLEHPNIVRAYDADETRGTYFLVMEYVRGQSLDELIRRSGPFSLEQSVDCILQAAKGLQFAHERGIIHRDIKPGNLMLTEDGRVKVLDMGLANVDESFRLAQESGALLEGRSGQPQISQAELTKAGTVLGTVSFMAPEQSLDATQADPRSDMYSLGCTLYYLLSGEAPYRGDTIFQVFLQHRDGPIPAVRDKRPDVPPPVDALCQRMLAKLPEDRYQTMGELINAIDACKVAFPKQEMPRKEKSSPRTRTREARESAPKSGNRSTRTPGHRRFVWGVIAVAGLLATLYGGYQFLPPVGTAPEITSVPAAQETAESASENPEDDVARVVAVDEVDEANMSAAELLATGEYEWRVEKNLGAPINSEAREMSADVSADGLTLVFTSDRTGGHGQEDIWMSTRAALEENWTEPINLGPGINTPAIEEHATLSADALTLMFTERNNGTTVRVCTRETTASPWSESAFVGNGGSPDRTPDGLTLIVSRPYSTAEKEPSPDLYLGRRPTAGDLWPEMQRIGEPISTAANREFTGTLTNDGKLLIFQRNVIAKDNFWMSARSGWDAPWPEPVPIDSLNSDNWDSRPRLLADGKSLLFASNRPGGEGSMDIYLARLVRKESPKKEPSAADLLATGEWEWRVEENIGAPINSEADEKSADMSADGLTLVFSSDRPGGHGQEDIWMSTRSSLVENWSEPVNLGPKINSHRIQEHATLSSDGLTLMFTDRKQPHEIWVCQRESSSSLWSDPTLYGIGGSADLTPDNRALVFNRWNTYAVGKKSTDLFLSRRLSPDASWPESQRIEAPISTLSASEWTGTLSEDGRLIIFHRGWKEKSSFWMSTRPNWDAPWPEPVRIDSLNSDYWDNRPRLLADGKSLLFASNRPGGVGGMDIYLARLVRKEPAATRLATDSYSVQSDTREFMAQTWRVAGDLTDALDAKRGGADTDGWVDLLPLLDLERDARIGDWHREASGLVVKPRKAARYQIPVGVDGSYEFKVGFTRTSGEHSVNLLLPAGDSRFSVIFDGWFNGGYTGLEKVEGKLVKPDSDNPTIVHRQGLLKTGVRHEAVATVELMGNEVRIRATLDGEELIDWTGPQNALNPMPEQSTPNESALGVFAWRSDVQFDEIKLRSARGAKVVALAPL